MRLKRSGRGVPLDGGRPGLQLMRHPLGAPQLPITNG